MRFAYLIEPPFNFRDAAGSVTGCDVELARTILSQVGQGEPELVETEFAALLPGLASRRWRMTTGLFATDARRQLAAFSRPIWALADGLLVRQGNPRGIAGYGSLTRNRQLRLAVVRGQVQEQTARALGVAAEGIVSFETYGAAAAAVAAGAADAYASVARAHAGFLAMTPGHALEVVQVPPSENPPACGAFAFARDDVTLLLAVDEALRGFLGSPPHRALMRRFGFGDEEVDLVARTGAGD